MLEFVWKLKEWWKDEQKKMLIISSSIGICGAFAIYRSTPWGPSVGSDSVMYLLSAQNLVDVGYFGIIWGQGSLEPLAHYPPALPLLIAGLYALGMNVLVAMRLIDIIFFGLLLFGVSFISYQVTRIPSLSVQLGIFCFCAPFIFASYTDAMSESLFYFFMVLGLLCLLLHLEKKSPSVLIFSAAFASGAFMTRYIGIAIPIACILGILFLSQQGWKIRIYNAFIYSLISIGPCLIWLLWIFLGTSNLGHRVARNTVDLWASSIDFRKGLFLVIWDWLTLGAHENASYDVQKLSIVLFFCVIGVLCVFLFYKTIRRPEKSQYLVLIHWVMLFALTTGVYVVAYFLAYSLTVPPPDLIDRIASPIFITIIMMIFGMIFLAIELWRDKKWVGRSSWFFLIIVVSVYLPKTAMFASTMIQEGRGYTSREWRESPVIQAIQQLPDDIPIVTNDPAAVLFLTGREAVWVSEALGMNEKQPEQYGKSETDLGETVFRNGGALVLFPSFFKQQRNKFYGAAEERLRVMLDGLALYKGFGPNSGIYFYKLEYVP